jgi:hypothetical protein
VHPLGASLLANVRLRQYPLPGTIRLQAKLQIQAHVPLQTPACRPFLVSASLALVFIVKPISRGLRQNSAFQRARTEHTSLTRSAQALSRAISSQLNPASHFAAAVKCVIF